MSMSTDPTRAVQFGGAPERRANSRFPVQEELTYRVIHSRTAPVNGNGETLNIGSGGVLFTTREKLPVGRTVELAVNWPAKLGGTCPLKFVAVGRVVRSDDNCAAVRIQRYEFKTRATRVEAPVPLRLQASR
jgi:PilZ domain